MTDKNLDRIKNLGFEILDRWDTIPEQDTLFVTGCCAKKKDVDRCEVKDLYLSPRCTSFMSRMAKYNSGIISEKYGLVRLTQVVDNYDFGPKDLKENPHLIPLLQEKLKDQIKETGVKNLVLFGPPLMTMGFMNLLSKVECNKYLCFGTNRVGNTNIIPNKKSDPIVVIKPKDLWS
jgi:hypothetical protein